MEIEEGWAEEATFMEDEFADFSEEDESDEE